MTDCQRQHGEGEELSRTGARHLCQNPRHDPGTEHHCQAGKDRDLGKRDEDRKRQRLIAGIHAMPGSTCAACASGKRLRQYRQQNQRQNCHQVFDDQPADSRPSGRRIELIAFLERL